jgi:hypothetical protein
MTPTPIVVSISLDVIITGSTKRRLPTILANVSAAFFRKTRPCFT